MEPLIIENDGTLSFLIEFEKDQDFETFACFCVYEVPAWNTDHSPEEKELYLRGIIKWDGCSHITFGGEDNDGYIHLCGKYCFENHIKVINAIWDVCSKKIKKFDFDVSS